MTEPFSGVLEIDLRKHGFIRKLSMTLAPSSGDIYVSQSMIGKYNLRQGVVVEGIADTPRQSQPATEQRSRRHGRFRNAAPQQRRGPEAVSFSLINGMEVEKWRAVEEFSSHPAVSPSEIITLEGPKSDRAMRIIDLFCPLGKGQRVSHSLTAESRKDNPPSANRAGDKFELTRNRTDSSSHRRTSRRSDRHEAHNQGRSFREL